MRLIRMTAAAVLSLALAGLAAAQDTSMHGHAMGSDVESMLPDACRAAAEPPAMAEMQEMESAMAGLSEAQRAYIEGMMATEGPMMRGMMAADPDVAFACAMIPHHQGAIAMSEVELKHGDSDQMKRMAQAIIEAQKREIAELTQWIEEQAP